MREERLREGKMSCPPSIDREALKAQNSTTIVKFHEYLELAEIGAGTYVRCVICGYVFCDDHDNYKKYALLRERDLGEASLRALISKAPIWVVYQEYICPGCGTLLEVDNFCPRLDSPEERILWDIELKLPGRNPQVSENS